MHEPARLGALALLALASQLGGLPAAASPPSWAAVAREAGPAIVTIATDRGRSSGFLVGSDGTIVTRHQGLESGPPRSVTLHSGETYTRVSIVRADPDRNLAILRVDGFDLPVLRLGNSNDCELGEPVLAMGSTGSGEQTVASGLVSSIRNANGSRLIHTDVSATPGTAGGPLLNGSGEAIGVATSGLDGSSPGIAIPINYARGLLSALDPEPAARPVQASGGDVLEPLPAGPAGPRGILVAGHGEEDVYSLLFVDLLNFLGRKGVAIANRPDSFVGGEGEEVVPLPFLFRQARELNAEGLLFLRTGGNHVLLQCYGPDERLVWAASVEVKGARDETIARNLMAELQVRLIPRIGGPGLPLKPASAEAAE